MLFKLFIIAAVGYVPPWGKDAELVKTVHLETPPLPPITFAGRVAEKIILFHQNIISPVDGPRSHFRPTSSRYMLLAIRRHGFIKGYVMGCDRLMRENKEEWVYRTRLIDGEIWKWDPTFSSQDAPRKTF